MAASRYDENPFTEREIDQLNPFSDPLVHTQTSTFRLDTVQREPKLQPRSSADIDLPLGGIDIRKKEKELNAREKRLIKWEKELKQREEALAKATLYLEPRNFPPCFPVIHHDIAGDMPNYLRFRARLALASWIGILLALFWNIIALTVAWKNIDKHSPQNVDEDGKLFGTWIVMVLYVLAGSFGSYILWYRPLYRALRRESAGRYICFFLFYTVHIGFCIYAAIAPKVDSKINALTGFISTKALHRKGFHKAAIFYAVGTTLYTLEILVSIYLINSIYMYLRGIGKAADMKRIASHRGPF